MYLTGSQVLGTEGGGTKEIVEQNVARLLHPMGRPGLRVLAENLRFLLKKPDVRQGMGMEGRKMVERKYLKRHMYKRFVELLTRVEMNLSLDTTRSTCSRLSSIISPPITVDVSINKPQAQHLIANLHHQVCSKYPPHQFAWQLKIDM
ncbi:hypothetical protein V6N13_023896 [Hibiscus sabdariffa]